MHYEVNPYAPKTTWKLHNFQAAVHMLGYDPNKVKMANHFNDLPEDVKCKYPDGMKSFDNGQWDCDMCADLGTGIIWVFPNTCPSGYEKCLLAHEVFHFATKEVWETIYKQYKRGYGELLSRFEFMIDMDSLEDIDWVSEYTHECHKKYLEGTLDFFIYMSEVLSEMAKVYEMNGELPNTCFWKKLYRTVEQTAIELGVLKR